ncbi:MAG: class I SAM-dependent RNA methyltransferase [Verrucomicrobiae bacterium]|nr:class I SAM-dependent RNA methyltransferase [Verrucomicrobiae bacterium]
MVVRDATAPVEVLIRDVAFGGAGVGTLLDGRAVFVPFTLAGERVGARVTRKKKGWAEAELLEVLEPSPSRVAPLCPVFGRCGGCAYQHADGAEQLRIKAKQTRDALERIGGLKGLPEIRAEAAPSPWEYRNKITVHGGPRGEIGFFAADGRTVVDVARCVIANAAVNAELGRLRRSGRRVRHATIEDLAEREASPKGSFHQVNAATAARLLAWVREQVEGGARLLDAYCSAGFFAFGLADLFGEICGVDRDPRAIAAATARAVREKRENLRFFAAPIEEKLGWFLEDGAAEKTVVLADPPREGLAPAAADALVRARPARLLYVSCNPATLARDLGKLAGEDGPFRVETLAVFDMFPQTAAIEVGARLEPR